MRSADWVLRKMRIEDWNPASSGDDFFRRICRTKYEESSNYIFGDCEDSLGWYDPSYK